jgi:hypothetical protein
MGDDDAPIMALFQDIRGTEFNAQIAALTPVGKDSHATARLSASSFRFIHRLVRVSFRHSTYLGEDQRWLTA